MPRSSLRPPAVRSAPPRQGRVAANRPDACANVTPPAGSHASSLIVTRPPLIPPTDVGTHPLRSRWLGTRPYWLCQVSGWGLLGGCLAFSTLYSIPPSKTMKADLVLTFVAIVLGVVVTHLLRVILLALRQRQVSWRPLIATLGAALVFGAMALINPTAWAEVAWFGVDDDDLVGMSIGAYLSTVALFVMLLLVWVCFYFGGLYYRRHRQATIDQLTLDAAVKEAELRALRTQINPHFLFNSLNCLRALVPRELTRPREAITILADLLRANLTLGHNHLIPLSRELEMADNYLALEQLRFESRLRVQRQIAPSALPCLVPSFVIQTLIENAIKFGVARFEEGGDVVLRIEVVEADQLEIAVENRGQLDDGTPETGVGIRNARARLALLFGPTASLTLRQVGKRVIATVSLPVRQETPST